MTATDPGGQASLHAARESQTAALGGDVVFMETSAGEIFPKQVIDLNLSPTQGIPASPRHLGGAGDGLGIADPARVAAHERRRAEGSAHHMWPWGCGDRGLRFFCLPGEWSRS